MILSDPSVAENSAAKMETQRELDFEAIRQKPNFAKLIELNN